MLSNEDIYTGLINPSTNINPKIIGAFYINTKTAKLFVCKDNTINKNVWEMCNPDVKIPEIPVPKFKFSIQLSDTGRDIMKPNVWYPNTTDELWFFTGNTGSFTNGYILRICKIGDEENYTGFETHYPTTLVVPKGYQFKMLYLEQTIAWVKVWL